MNKNIDESWLSNNLDYLLENENGFIWEAFYLNHKDDNKSSLKTNSFVSRLSIVNMFLLMNSFLDKYSSFNINLKIKVDSTKFNSSGFSALYFFVTTKGGEDLLFERLSRDFQSNETVNLKYFLSSYAIEPFWYKTRRFFIKEQGVDFVLTSENILNFFSKIMEEEDFIFAQKKKLKESLKESKNNNKNIKI